MNRAGIVILGGLMAAAPTAATGSTGGGAYVSPAATIASVTCRTDCAGPRTARPGSLLRLRGTRMKGVARATFVGAPGPRDDVTVPVAQATPRSVVVQVPANAASGRLRLRGADGALSAPSRQAIAVAGAIGPADEREPPAPAVAVADRDTSGDLDAHVDTNTVFYEGYRKATFRYRVTGPAPVAVAVELRGPGGALVQRWTPGVVAPGPEQQVGWDGTAGGAVVPGGTYEFRVFPADVTATAAQAPDGDPPLVADSFRFLDHKFPIRGRHTYGEGPARFGAGRGGAAHQGQDVFAACGTPLVAARGGTVRFKAFHARAGNYVVIDGDGTDQDYAYMHLQAPALVERGDHVATGQRIGNVGDTGRASGCHLHFELWSGPGWYEGGRPLDPLAALRSWDAQSGALTR
jgi:murein DD-endopeptidase MepM/ murein hydrolase activator NlpD